MRSLSVSEDWEFDTEINQDLIERWVQEDAHLKSKIPVSMFPAGKREEDENEYAEVRAFGTRLSVK